jgi:hypothetical protein
VDLYLDALGSIGIDAKLEFLDDVVPDEPQGDDEWKLIKATLRDRCTHRSSQFLVILGGTDIIPFCQLPDRTPD